MKACGHLFHWPHMYARIGLAATLFLRALELAKIVQTSQRAWTNTYLNLGTVYRKLASQATDQNTSYQYLQEAKEAYSVVVKMDPRNQTALAFLGVTSHLLGDIDGAIVKYHEVFVRGTPFSIKVH